MKIKLNTVLFLMAAFCGSMAFGQTTLERSVVATSGMSLGTGTYHLQSTTGQLAVRSADSGAYSLSEGFQQGNLLVTARDTPRDFFPESRVFPVPTVDILHLETRARRNSTNLKVSLLDIRGQVLEVPTTDKGDGKFQFDLSGLASGTYLLWLMDESSGQQKSWKISKLH